MTDHNASLPSSALARPAVGVYQVPPVEDAKRHYVELFGSALVMNAYLKVALLALCGVAVALVTLLLAFNYSGARGLVSIFNFTILLSTLANLIPYVFCSIAPALVARRMGITEKPTRGAAAVSVIAFLYSGWAIYGAGAQIALLGLLLMVAGSPVYVWLRRNAAV